jgi:hypothetical protein
MLLSYKQQSFLKPYSHFEGQMTPLLPALFNLRREKVITRWPYERRDYDGALNKILSAHEN